MWRVLTLKTKYQSATLSDQPQVTNPLMGQANHQLSTGSRLYHQPWPSSYCCLHSWLICSVPPSVKQPLVTCVQERSQGDHMQGQQLDDNEALTLGGPVTLASVMVSTVNSHCSMSTDTWNQHPQRSGQNSRVFSEPSSPQGMLGLRVGMSGQGPGQKMTRVDKSTLEVLLFLHNTLWAERDRKWQKW